MLVFSAHAGKCVGLWKHSYAAYIPLTETKKFLPALSLMQEALSARCLIRLRAPVSEGITCTFHITLCQSEKYQIKSRCGPEPGIYTGTAYIAAPPSCPAR